MVRPPMPWGGPGAAYGYGYQYGSGPAPCGCAAVAPVAWTWVPVRIETRYRYSAPIRHEREIVEEHVAHETVVETKTVPAHRETKYVKSAPPAKYTKGKVVKTTK
jgi:hypothetical protein